MKRVTAFTFGMFAMIAAADPTPADGQDKKDPALKAPFDQFVKFEGADGKGNSFTVDKVPAYMPDTKASIWRVQAVRIEATANRPYKNVVITDKNGKAHKVADIKLGPGPYLTCRIAASE